MQDPNPHIENGKIVAQTSTHKATKTDEGILIQRKGAEDPGYLLTTVEDAKWELEAILIEEA